MWDAGGGGSLEPRTAIEGSFSAWGGLGKLDPDSDSDSDKTFQISRKLGLVHVEFFCLLDSQPWLYHVPYAKKLKICLLSIVSFDAIKWSLGVLYKYVESNWTEFLYF
jgi:hypothetical protein